MLTISRRPGESIHIGDEIVIHIHRFHGSQIRISIDAPQQVRILRSELIIAEDAEKTPGRLLPAK